MNMYYVMSGNRYFGPFDSHERALHWVRSQVFGTYEIRNVFVWRCSGSEPVRPISLGSLCREYRNPCCGDRPLTFPSDVKSP